MDYLPLYIAAGSAGAYSPSAYQSIQTYDTRRQWDLYVKSAPFSIVPEIKNIVSQEWADEDGDDEFLPETVAHKPYEISLEFASVLGSVSTSANIAQFVQAIEGKWLAMYDSYTMQGRKGMRLVSQDGEPKYWRRGDKTIVTFRLRFKVNDPSLGVRCTETIVEGQPQYTWNGLTD